MNFLARLYACVQMMIGVGIIRYVNDADGIQRIQVQFGDNEVVDNIRRFQEYGYSSKPKTGTHVVTVCIRGDRSNAAIIATNDLRSRPTDLEDGEVEIYDDLGQKVFLSRSGIVVETTLKATLRGADVVIHAGETLKVDCGGNGFLWTPNTRLDYSRGLISSTSTDLHPPEIP